MARRTLVQPGAASGFSRPRSGSGLGLLIAGTRFDGFSHVDDWVPPQRLVTATGPNPLPRPRPR